jgi:hypothetical protein
MKRGTPMVSSLYARSVTPAIRGVDVGDELEVVFVGDRWVARLRDEEVGQLTWSAKRRGQPDPVTGSPLWDFDAGVLHVERVTINAEGEVVDIGGYVTPKGGDRR